MTKSPKSELSESEIAKRRDETLLRALKMPPKPHAEIAGKRPKKPKKIRGTAK